MKRQLPITAFTQKTKKPKENAVILDDEIQKRHAIRDKQIKFTEEGHSYTINHDFALSQNNEHLADINYTSVTTLIKQYFPEFPEEKIAKQIAMYAGPRSEYYGMDADSIMELWAETRLKAQEEGTSMHLYFEKILLGETNSIEHLHEENKWCLEKMYNEIKKIYPFLLRYKIYKPEWRIFDEFNYICGSVDCVLVNEEMSHFIVIDWKKSKEIYFENKYDIYGNHKITSHLKDTNYVHYSIQLNIYKRIIESRYDLPVEKMFVININPIKKRCEIYEIQSMQDTVTAMFCDSKLQKLKKKGVM